MFKQFRRYLAGLLLPGVSIQTTGPIRVDNIGIVCDHADHCVEACEMAFKVMSSDNPPKTVTVRHDYSIHIFYRDERGSIQINDMDMRDGAVSEYLKTRSGPNEVHH